MEVKVVKKSDPRFMADDIPDLAEPFLDEASSKIAKELFSTALPDLVKDLPILKYIKTATDIYGAYRITMLNRRIRAFIAAIQAGNFDIEDFRNLSKSEQSQVVDVLMTELDNHTDDLQSEALGYLFAAYVSGKIDRLIFIGVAHELKNTNPLVFYFNVDSYSYELRNENSNFDGLDFGFTKRPSGTTIDNGPVQYLPAAFKSNSTAKLAFSSELYMSNLGEAFFEHVYSPMKRAHVI